MEPYIAQSLALFEAVPQKARVSMRYTHKRVRHTSEATADGAPAAAVVFKTFDPQSGVCYRYRVTKAQELARVLIALGPRALDVHSRSLGGEVVNSRKRGMTSYMANIELPDEEAQPQEAPSGDKKKKKKRR